MADMPDTQKVTHPEDRPANTAWVPIAHRRDRLHTPNTITKSYRFRPAAAKSEPRGQAGALIAVRPSGPSQFSQSKARRTRSRRSSTTTARQFLGYVVPVDQGRRLSKGCFWPDIPRRRLMEELPPAAIFQPSTFCQLACLHGVRRRTSHVHRDAPVAWPQSSTAKTAMKIQDYRPMAAPGYDGPAFRSAPPEPDLSWAAYATERLHGWIFFLHARPRPRLESAGP